jgi:hypothetical protein
VPDPPQHGNSNPDVYGICMKIKMDVQHRIFYFISNFSLLAFFRLVYCCHLKDQSKSSQLFMFFYLQASPPPETSVFPEMELLTPSPVPPPAQAQVGLGLCFESGIFYS